MKPKNLYLLLCFLGVALPYSEFVPWVISNGLNVRLFLHQLMANRISAFFGADVLVSAIVLLTFVRLERSPRGFQRWLPLLLTLGVSPGLPPFLYQRESSREAERSAVSPIAA